MRNKIVVPEISYISTQRAQEMMDSFGKMLVTAYEVWKREKRAVDLIGYSPDQLCAMFIQDIIK